MSIDLSYRWKSEINNEISGHKQRNILKRRIDIRYLRESQRNQFYNKDLGIFIYNQKSLEKIYEISIRESVAMLCKESEQASDIHRRLLYADDWAQISSDFNGNIVSILNEEELRERFETLRKSFSGQYVINNALDSFLEKIGEELSPEVLKKNMSRYYNFGLVFPGVSLDYKKNPEQERIVKLSRYLEEFFRERIVFRELRDGMRYYDISGELLPGSQFESLEYTGEICFPESGLFPESCSVRVSYRDEMVFRENYFELKMIAASDKL